MTTVTLRPTQPTNTQLDDPLAPPTHTVKKGETLDAIAKQYGVTLDALEQANPQMRNMDRITAGQVLNIPAATPPQDAPAAAGATPEPTVERPADPASRRTAAERNRPAVDATRARLESAVPATAASTTATGEVTHAKLDFTPNAKAIESARTSELGQNIDAQFEKNRSVYERASKLTGVPASMIASLHANESQMGTYRTSTRGPESGFGLDDRFVTTRWGNDKLAKHGLGKWERGTGTERSKLQSAVIAAEHLKRQAATAGVTISDHMTASETAAAVTSYMGGSGMARRALERGTSFMFNPSDENPHPLHPGGTSRGRGGRTIQVEASRKEGLLRWDVLLPMFEERFKTPAPTG